MIPTTHVLIVSAILFVLGVLGVFLRRNAIIIFMSIELMLNAVNLGFIAFARQHGTLDGQVASLFVMTVAAAEAAIGLAIILAIYRKYKTLDIDKINVLKG